LNLKTAVSRSDTVSEASTPQRDVISPRLKVERLGKFSLKVEPTKTKVIELGEFAVRNTKQKNHDLRTN
jgi:hypothetical protein